MKRKTSQFNMKLMGQSNEDKLKVVKIGEESHWNFEKCVVYLFPTNNYLEN